jgi:hypothetical protein
MEIAAFGIDSHDVAQKIDSASGSSAPLSADASRSRISAGKIDRREDAAAQQIAVPYAGLIVASHDVPARADRASRGAASAGDIDGGEDAATQQKPVPDAAGVTVDSYDIAVGVKSPKLWCR